jgi:hypothetical protein
VDKPARLLDRGDEWRTLTGYITHPDPHLRIAVVAGRRRVGKSFLLRALAEAAGGMYVSAVAEEDAPASRRRLANAIARYAGVGQDLVSGLADWEQLLAAAIDLVVQRNGPSGLLVIDEFPYWLAHSPQVEGVLQLIYDQSRATDGPAGGRVVLCGSALSVMNTLLSGHRALRGRAAVDLRLHPFDFRTSARHWGIEDPSTALHLFATLGGSAGYRDLSPTAAPQRLDDFDDWVCRSVLAPGQAIFSRTESEYLLREDPKFTGSSLHYAILRAVAAGATSPAQIGSVIERDRTAFSRSLEALVEAGYLRYDQDPLWKRRPVIMLVDQIVRFHNLVTVPQNDLVETGHASQAWQNARPTFRSRILGSQFEECARDWVRRYGPDEASLLVATVAPAIVSDGPGRPAHEVDVINVAGRQVSLVGEAKATIAPVGSTELHRLDRIAGILTDQQRDASRAVRALFSMRGFRDDLVREARERGDVLLVDLPALLGATGPVVAPRLGQVGRWSDG